MAVRQGRRAVALAVGLSALAGYVDALGFITLNGTFVAFMSGNLTRLGVSLADGLYAAAAVPAAILFLFVLGVMAGSLLNRVLARRQRQACLGFVTLLLFTGSMLHGLGHHLAAIAALTVAMGAENAVFERNGEVTIGLTYMTGTLVKMGQRMVTALLGGPRLDWVPDLMLWTGLVAGAIVGALAFQWIGLDALWFAAIGAAVVTVLSPLAPRS